MGYQDRVFHVVAPETAPSESKWPLHKTFWVVTGFCAAAWIGIIIVVVMMV